MNECVQEKQQCLKAGALRKLLKDQRENPHCFILKYNQNKPSFFPVWG